MMCEIIELFPAEKVCSFCQAPESASRKLFTGVTNACVCDSCIPLILEAMYPDRVEQKETA